MQVYKAKVLLWSFFMLPFLGVLNFNLVYVVFLINIIFFGLTLKKISFPPLLIVKLLCLFLLLFVYFYDKSSQINLIGLILGDLFIFLVALYLLQFGINAGVYILLKMLAAMVVFGFVFSFIFSTYLDLANPVIDLLLGERLRILNSSSSGHSLLVDVSALALACAFYFYRFNRKFWSIIIFVSVILLLLSKTFTSILIAGVILYSVGVERLRLGFLAKALIHLIFITFITLFYLNPDSVNEDIGIIRADYLGQDTTLHHGDYTSGRAPLNELMLNTADSSPYIGVGNDDPILRLGLNAFDSDKKMAISESSFRIAAKYGYPYFFIVVAFFVSPLFSIFSTNSLVRRLFIPIGYISLITSLNGSAFEVAHSYSYYIFGAFSCMYLLISYFKYETNVSCLGMEISS